MTGTAPQRGSGSRQTEAAAASSSSGDVRPNGAADPPSSTASNHADPNIVPVFYDGNDDACTICQADFIMSSHFPRGLLGVIHAER